MSTFIKYFTLIYIKILKSSNYVLDEYEVKIIIPEKNDEKKSLTQINCKIIFFYLIL